MLSLLRAARRKKSAACSLLFATNRYLKTLLIPFIARLPSNLALNVQAGLGVVQ